MKKIAIEIKDNTLYFKYRTNKPVPSNLLNTNVISDNELVFSDDYIKSNLKIVALFLADLFQEQEVKKVIISNNEMAHLILDVLKAVNNIDYIIFKEDNALQYSLCEKIIKCKNIKKINCYAIPTFMIEMLDKANIEVESRNEVLFTSAFMQENNLTSFSKIYYKSNVRISHKLTEDDIEDFKSFIKINRYIKTIHLEKCIIEDIKTLGNLLIKARKKGIMIQIHEDVNDLDIIEKLRTLNKIYKKKNKIKLSLVYSKDYLQKNYVKQIIFTTLKFCALIIFVIVGSIFGYIFYNNYQSERKVEDIKEEIKEVMEEPKKEDDKKEEELTPLESYQKLLEVNNDTVGWLKVNGTKIDYPVVKTTDNSYYLKRNFKREKDYNGWVFMDYRNNPEDLDSNTIIYAHNRYYSGVMFGTLNNVLKKSWLNNQNNYNITFNTLYSTMTWKVFSIYNIEVTSDYLYTNFNTNEEYQNFINMLKNRSKFKFDTEVTTNDKILTLSTCLDNNRRLVVHAVLQQNEENNQNDNNLTENSAG